MTCGLWPLKRIAALYLCGRVIPAPTKARKIPVGAGITRPF